MCCIAQEPIKLTVYNLYDIAYTYCYLTYVITCYRFQYLFVLHEGAFHYPVGRGILFHVPIIIILPRREFNTICYSLLSEFDI